MRRANFEFGIYGWRFWKLLGLGLLSIVAAHVPGSAQVNTLNHSGPELTVRVHDSARVGSLLLSRASGEAGAVLRNAGIETVWIVCAESKVGFPGACHQTPAANELVLRIVRRAKATKRAPGCTQCGLAIEDDRGRGTYATLYADCLDTRPQVDGLLPSQMLGYLIAHEIGHLLLTGQDHASGGIMRPRISDREWTMAVKGQLVFTSTQAEALRGEIRTRVEEQRNLIQAGMPPGAKQ